MAGAAGYATAGGSPRPAEAPATRLDVLTRPLVFDWTIVVLSLMFAAAAYFDAWSYVNTPTGKSLLEPWQDFALHLAWLLFTGYLAVVILINIRRGRTITRTVPPGYGWCVVGSVGFPAMVLLDQWAQRVVGAEYGLSALFSPPRVGEIVCGAFMLTGPLRAQWQRQGTQARLLAVLGAALALSVITFATQFAAPFRDPWAASPARPDVVYWVAEDLGVAALLLQGMVISAVLLFLMRRFSVRFGSFTLICLVNGVLLASLKEHWEMIVAAATTGIGADVLYYWLKPAAARIVRLRIFAFTVPAVFAAAFFAVNEVTKGIWWPAPAWTGSILITGLGGLLVSYLVAMPVIKPSVAEMMPSERPVHWPEITASSVKEAFEALSDKRLLATSPLCGLPYFGRDGADPATELGDLLRDAARELSTSTDQRDAQAGHLLVDYYVKRNGTHDQIAERLHLSRPTYYHRQQRGCELIAARLEKLIAFTEPL